MDQHIVEQVGPLAIVTDRFYTGAMLRPLLIQGLVREFGNVRETDNPANAKAPADYVVAISELVSTVDSLFTGARGSVAFRCEVRGPGGDTLGDQRISTNYMLRPPPFGADLYLREKALGRAIEACAKQAVAFITQTVDAKGEER